MDTTQLRQAVQPEQLRAALEAHAAELSHAAGPHHQGEDLVDVRTARYDGHEIVVRTRYEITVDGRPFDVAMSVTNDGRVHYHGLPTRDFASVVELVEKAIDIFGDEFAAAGADDAAAAGREHADGHQHGPGGEH